MLVGWYRNSLTLAVVDGLRTIAFSAISCRVYGYTILGAARIAVDTVVDVLSWEQAIERVLFACLGRDTMQAFEVAVGLVP